MKLKHKYRAGKIPYLFVVFGLLFLFLWLWPFDAFGAVPQNNFRIKALKRSLIAAGITEQEIEDAFAEAKIDKTVYKPKIKEFWLYKPESVERGRAFIDQYRVLLYMVEGLFKIEKTAMVSILAVETKFTDRLGDHRALDALITRYLFEGLKRGWLEKEILSWFLFCKKTNTNLFVPSSDWGATGPMQLMPSNALKYAIPVGSKPFNHLSVPDSFVSAANFLQQNGWQMYRSLQQPVSTNHILYSVYNHCTIYVGAVKKYAELIS